MKDTKRKALKNITDKDKHEMYQKLRERKKNLSPEAYTAYEKNMKEMMNVDEDNDTIKKLEQEELEMRRRILERRRKMK